MKIAYSIVKRIRQIVGLLLMSLMSIEVFAYDFEVNGIYYSIKEEIFQDGYYAEVAHGPIKYSGNITIPEKVSYNKTTYVVKSIEGYFVNGAFQNCDNLISVYIPNTVTTIGEYNQEIKGVTNVEIIPVST